MRSTFEEKTYESYFNIELEKQSKIFFPLGQVQEGSLGFDASAFSTIHRLWQYIGFSPFRGCELEEIASEMERFLNIEINNMPKMKVNLLFQYKKPEYMKSSTSKEWKNWGKPYYRYNIYQEQQKLLMNIHNKLGSSVLIMYAAPALYDINDLVKVYIKGKIIKYSNFRKASELKLHHRNTYIQGGTYSIACSDEEKINNFDLIELLDIVSRERNNDEEESNTKFIINFTNRLFNLISENSYYSKSFFYLNKLLVKIQEYELLYSFLVLRNIRQLTGLQWLVKL